MNTSNTGTNTMMNNTGTKAMNTSNTGENKMKKIYQALTVSMLLAVPATVTQAATRNWNSGEGGSWNNASKWGGTVPTGIDAARIGQNTNLGGELAVVNASAASFDKFIIGQNSSFPSRISTVLIQSGGALVTTSTAGASTGSRIGSTSVGILNVTGGSLTMAGSYSSDAGGQFNISGGIIDIAGSSIYGGSSGGTLALGEKD